METPRPFLNDDNYKTLAGKTRAELRAFRRSTAPAIPAPTPAPAFSKVDPPAEKKQKKQADGAARIPEKKKTKDTAKKHTKNGATENESNRAGTNRTRKKNSD